MIFGIITTSNISKLLLLKFWNITSGIHAKYHVQIMILFVYTTTRKRFVIFTCRYFKLSWNTTALSQSNCRNLSCSRLLIVYSNNSIKILYYYVGMLVLFIHLYAAVVCFVTQGCFSFFVGRHLSWRHSNGPARRELNPMQPFCLVTHHSFPLSDKTK